MTDNKAGRVLVLGAAGFLGRYVSRLFAQMGWHVTGIGHGDWPADAWRHHGLSAWHQADVDEASLLAHAGQPDLILQCAGSGSVADSFADPAEDFRRTVGPTLAALDYIRLHAPACRLVLPSSAAVYGACVAMPISIDAPRQPQSPYGVHKAIAEDLCRSYGRTFGVSVAIVRLFSIYGHGLRKQLPWDACRKLSQGEAVFGGHGDERRDWLHVEDAALLLAKAAEHAAPDCPTANGGTGQSATICMAVTRLNDALGRPGTISFSDVRRTGDPDVYEADIAEALAWGWRPLRPLDEGLADYARWYRDGAP